MRFFAYLLVAGMALGATCCRTSPRTVAESLNLVTKTGYRSWDVQDAIRSKTLQCEVWYPVDAKASSKPVTDSSFKRAEAAIDAPIAPAERPYPLILLAPSFGFGPDSLAWLAEILVSHGYVVAGVRHDDISLDGTPNMDLWQRPQDITALLNSILTSTLAPDIDEHRIGLVGYDAGGLSAVWLGGGVANSLEIKDLMPTKEDANLQSFKAYESVIAKEDVTKWKQVYRDPRIKAYFLMAPSWGWLFKESDFKNMPVSVFVVAGTDDNEVDTSRNAVHYAQWIPQAQFKELHGHAGHWEFLGEFTPRGATAAKSFLPVEAIPTLPLEHRRRIVHQEVGTLAVDFFNHHLPETE